MAATIVVIEYLRFCWVHLSSTSLGSGSLHISTSYMRLVVGPNVVFFILVIMVIEVIVVMTYFNENIVLFLGNSFKITKTTMITAISLITKIAMINTIGSVYMLV